MTANQIQLEDQKFTIAILEKKKKLPQKVKGKQFQDESLLVQGEREMLCVYVCGCVCVCAWVCVP